MKRDELFEVMEPPPFGLERLRAKMKAPRVSWTWRLTVASVLAAAVLVVVAARPRPEAVDLVEAAANTAAGVLVGKPARDPVMALEETAVESLPSSNADVIIYRVASL